MSVPETVIEKLNLNLGIAGQPHRIMFEGEIVDTGCVEWAQTPGLPQIFSEMTPGFKDAFRRSQELMQKEPTNEPQRKLDEFFSHEPAQIQAEYARFIEKMKRASSPFGEAPAEPEVSKDFQAACERILGQASRDAFQNGKVFDVHRYSEKADELFKLESPSIQAQRAALTARSEEISKSYARMVRRKKRTLKQVREILQNEPVVAYRAGIELDRMTSPGYDTIVVAPTTDQFDILRYERANGANHGLQTEGIIERLKVLDEKYGLDIVGVVGDGLEFRLKQAPKGKQAQELGKWLLEFCPDLYEAPKSFPKGKVALCWD